MTADPRERKRTSEVELKLVDRLCDEFEAAWLRGERPLVEEYLERLPHPRRPDLLRELLALELEYSSDAGGKLPAKADYERRFAQWPEIVRDVFDNLDVSTADHRASSSDTHIPGASRPPADRTIDESAAAPPDVPGYEIQGVLGRGAMGVVYQARHLQLGRVVALKMLLAGRHSDPQHLDRFRREAEAVAALQHPSIVQVFEVGEHDGLPFCTLEFVAGGNLRQRIDGKPQPLRQAAACVADLARAVHAAHSQGVIHRDIKPSNVLLAADGSLKLTDFGLARRVQGDSQHTKTGDVIGTPSYMSPEQAAGRADEVGVRSDVYALGAVLYEMLTGRPPFQGETPWDTIAQVLTQEPVAPRRLQPKVPRDLETVCLKCLEKRPARRYASAEELVDDLQRFLENKPVVARPLTTPARVGKWVRRRPAAAGFIVASLIAMLTLIGLLVGLSYSGRLEAALGEARQQRGEAQRQRSEADKQRVEADNQRIEAETQRNRANVQERLAQRYLYLARMKDSHRSWHLADVVRMKSLLALYTPHLKDEKDLRGFEWHFLRRLPRNRQRILKGHEKRVTGVAVGFDGKFIASTATDGSVRLWEAATGKHVRTLSDRAAAGSSVAFSPVDNRLAFTLNDGTLQIIDAETGQPRQAINAHQRTRYHNNILYSVAFSPDGERLVTTGYKEPAAVWDAATGKKKLDLKLPAYSAVYSGDGGLLAAATRDRNGNSTREVVVWDASTGDVKSTLRGASDGIFHVTMNQDGSLLAAAGKDGAVYVWTVADAALVYRLYGHGGEVRAVAFSPDGTWIASAGRDKLVRLWEAATGRALPTLIADADRVQVVDPYLGYFEPSITWLDFSPNGRRLVSGCWDYTVNVWDLASQDSIRYARPAASRIRRAFARDDDADRSLAGYAGPWRPATEGIELDTDEFRRLWCRLNREGSPAVSPDGKRIAAAGAVWNAESGERECGLEGVKTGRFARGGHYLFSPDGNRVVSISDRIRIWNSADGKLARTFERTYRLRLFSAAFSPDGRRLVTGGEDWRVRLWDITTGKQIKELVGHTWGVRSVAFSADGKWISSGSGDKTARIWRAHDGKPLLVLEGHTDGLRSAAFSPDGDRLATGGDDGKIIFWDTQTGEQALTLTAPSGGISDVAFSRDGGRLISQGADGIQIWDGRPLDAPTE